MYVGVGGVVFLFFNFFVIEGYRVIRSGSGVGIECCFLKCEEIL